MIGYRQYKMKDRYDTIVIGSGAGGLAAAVLLAKHGDQSVLVLERHYVAGGFTQSFRRPGFDWDVGVHYIGQLRDSKSPVRRLFDGLTGAQVEWTPTSDLYDRIIIGDRCYDFWTGEERFREKMKGYFPADGVAIDGYLEAVDGCSAAMGRYYAERVLPRWLAHVAGGMLQRPFLRYARRTTAEVIGNLTRNRELAGVLTAQWGCYGLPPGQSSFGIHAVVARHYFDGGSYPRGGANRIAAAMAPMIEEKGGAVVLRAEVAQIILDKQDRAAGVRMMDGREIHAANVISDAGAANTFHWLVPAGMPNLDSVTREIDSVPPSIAHICLYLGLEGRAPELGLSGTNLWVYKGPDHDSNYQQALSDPEGAVAGLCISSGSAKDPDFERRHPGHSTAEVAVWASYDPFRKWGNTRWQKRGPEYEAYKAQLTNRLLGKFYEYVPGARGRVVHAELSTPLSTRDCVNHPHGEIYGLACTPRRFELRRLGPRTPIRNLYLAGADACLPGVMGAFVGGTLAASVVLRRNLLSALLRP